MNRVGKKAVMICATKQHTGKTSLSMAVLQGLRGILGNDNVAYIKPVGQKYVTLQDGSFVDKDVRVAKEYFDLRSDYKYMSPIVIGMLSFYSILINFYNKIPDTQGDILMGKLIDLRSLKRSRIHLII